MQNPENADMKKECLILLKMLTQSNRSKNEGHYKTDKSTFKDLDTRLRELD